ncbi:tRNA-dihydrouridine synthase [Nocardioides limicola]|uniref:tRNA-dihydrouridine synthase n=1 Tax=Nocardioides limicola TaxID=2803368 RepID=UPI00193C5844|nr:tRNA-dihydrouridine synthase [Nocardioides sp. DJM-14]
MRSLGLSGPVLVAAGCGGTGAELARFGDLADLGGFVTRTLTLDPRFDHVNRISESPSGLVVEMGLPNPGVDAFCASELPLLVAAEVPVVVSLAAATLGEYAALARRIATAPGVRAVELCLGAADTGAPDQFAAREPFHAASVVAAVRRELPADVAVLAKVRLDLPRVVEASRTVVEAGADAVVVAHPLAALGERHSSGALCGPAAGPLARRALQEIRAQLPDVPTIACGGVGTPADVQDRLAAGAVAVQVGSANLHDPTTCFRLAAALRDRPVSDPTTGDDR